MCFISVPEGRPFKSFEEFCSLTGFQNGDYIDFKLKWLSEFVPSLQINIEKKADFPNEQVDIVIGNLPYTFCDLAKYYTFFCPITTRWTYFGVPYILQEDLRKISKSQEDLDYNFNFLKFRIGQIYISNSEICYAILDRFRSYLNEKEYLVLFCCTHPSFTDLGKVVEVKKTQDFEFTTIETPQGIETIKACCRDGN